MAETIPRFVLCVLGTWRGFDKVEATVARVGGSGFEVDHEFSQLEPDDRMADAFDAFYDRVSPSMTDADWQAVENHTAVAYVLSPPAPAKMAVDISRRALSLIVALLETGGVAAKAESSGIAHGRDRWLGLAADCVDAAKKGDEHGQRAALYRAWVRRPIQDDDEGVYYSCGMHLLGKRDIEVDTSSDINTAVQCIDLLGLHLLDDTAQRPVSDGGGFRLRGTGPRRVMRFGPCTRYEEDDICFNPYGYIRLEETDEPA
jgi:hypothetical protein